MDSTNLRSHRRPVPVGEARVMTVEDKLDNVVSTERLLAFSGVPIGNLVHKTMGTGVVQFAETEDRLDLILLDIGLPDEDGYEILRDLRSRARFASTRIIAITGRASADEMRKAQQAGFDGFIGKPLQPNRFPDQLRRFLNDQPVWEYR